MSIRMLTTALSETPERWNNHTGHLHRVEYYTAIRRTEHQWDLNERHRKSKSNSSQTQKALHLGTSLVWDTQPSRDRKQSGGCPVGEGRQGAGASQQALHLVPCRFQRWDPFRTHTCSSCIYSWAKTTTYWLTSLSSGMEPWTKDRTFQNFCSFTMENRDKDNISNTAVALLSRPLLNRHSQRYFLEVFKLTIASSICHDFPHHRMVILSTHILSNQFSLSARNSFYLHTKISFSSLSLYFPIFERFLNIFKFKNLMME